MSAYTPGPWRLDSQAANGETEIGISRSWADGGASICTVDSSRRVDVLLADPRLIAAAPEMLEALLGVLKVADRATVEFDAARAAIKLATEGRSHE